ncbi:ribonuclease III [Patescibacteria group bacterium]|nr:ribonuclease III [Patescibacteria group bacterium]MCL5114846.1 ribonuclease III [Patescibacteria group bacterium]
MQSLDRFEKILGIKFKNEAFLREALTHRSYLNEHPHWEWGQNERLEYLGDAVLELSASRFLFDVFPEFPEGRLTGLRAALVNYRMLSKVASEISLDVFLFMSKGEAKDSDKAKEIIMANAIEAVIGAIYLDQGYDTADAFVEKFVMTHLNEVLDAGLEKDPKSRLQEIVQEQERITPTYRVLKEEGPDHKRTFYVGVFFGDRMIEKGVGSSKQEAETNAAENAIQVLEQAQ